MFCSMFMRSVGPAFHAPDAGTSVPSSLIIFQNPEFVEFRSWQPPMCPSPDEDSHEVQHRMVTVVGLAALISHSH